MSDDYFFEVNEPYTQLDKFTEHIKIAKFKILNVQDQIYIKPKWWIDDPFIQDIKKQFGGEVNCFRLKSMTDYGWHQDYQNACNLNMVVEEYHSHTLFSTGRLDNTLNVAKLIELKYTPNKWVLFNAQKYHTVLNLDTKDRILLTFNFLKPRFALQYNLAGIDPDTSYDNVLKWIKNRQQY